MSSHGLVCETAVDGDHADLSKGSSEDGPRSASHKPVSGNFDLREMIRHHASSSTLSGQLDFARFFFKFVFLSRLASVWTGWLVTYYTST